jgi:hypothetical protein
MSPFHGYVFLTLREQILDIRTTRKILELATDQQAEIESDDSEIVAAADGHDMQLRDPTIFSENEDENDTNDPSDPGHDVSEAEAYAELVNHVLLHNFYNTGFDVIMISSN